MKKLFMAVMLLTSVFSQRLFAQDVQNVLPFYYGIKDALIAGDPNAAATKATDFQSALANVEMSKLSAQDHKTFMALKDKLSFDARHITEKKEIAHQREHFEALSANMLTLAKSVKLSDQPIYQEYCPMKKASWLSSEDAIKNPYYGSAMLTCGKVVTTLKP